jgi:hypothetical protein
MPKVSKRRRANLENWNKRFEDKTPDVINERTVDINNNEVTSSIILEEDFSTLSVAIQTDIEFKTNGFIQLQKKNSIKRIFIMERYYNHIRFV